MKRILPVIIMLFFSVLAFGQLRISQIEPIQGYHIKSLGEAASKVLTTNGSGGASWQIPDTWQTPLNGTGYVKMTGTTPSYDNTVVTSPLGFSSDYYIPMTIYGRGLEMSPMAVVDNVFYPGIKTHLGGYDLKISTMSTYSSHLTSQTGYGAMMADNLTYDPDMGSMVQDDPLVTSAGILTKKSVPFEIFTTPAGSTTYTRLMQMRTSGNLLINTMTDNAIDKLQVNGSGLFTGDLNVNGGDIFTTGSELKLNVTSGTSQQALRVLRAGGWIDNKNSTFLQLGKATGLDTAIISGAVGSMFSRLGIVSSYTTITSSHAYNAIPVPIANFNVYGTSYLNGTVTSTGTINSTSANGWAIGGLAATPRIQYVASAGPGTLGQFTTLNGSDGYANIRGATFESTATGVPPFVVANSGLVANLNSDMLDGQHGSYYQTALTNPIILSGSATANYVTKFTGVGNAIAASNIYDNGNVGINNTNPSGKLDVIATTGVSDYPTLATAGLVVRDDTPLAANTGGTILFTSRYNSGGSYLHGAPYIRAYKENATADDYRYGLKFGTRGYSSQQLSMTLTGNGALIIGNVTPNGDDKLQVAGTISGSNAEEIWQMPTWGQVQNQITFQVNGAVSGTSNYVAKFTDANSLGASSIFDDGSKVGIGTTIPGDKLHVIGTVTHSDATLDTQSATLGQVKSQVATVRNPYFIAGTGSIAGTWLGTEASITSYNNGLTIWYQIPVAGAATTTLNLNSLGAKTIYRSAANKLTTHYAVNAIVMLVYSTALNGGCFMTEGSDYDSDSYDKMFWGVNVIAGAAIYDYKIMMQGTNGKFYPLTLEEGSAATKTVSTQSFLLNTPILYYGTTTNVAADAAFSYNFTEINTTSLNQTANISSWTAYLPMYLKGTMQSDGTFKLDNTSYTSWLTQTLPVTDDGFVYIRLGYAYATGGFRLEAEHPVYHYKNGKVTIYDSSSGNYLPLAGGTLTGDLTISKTYPKLTFNSTINSEITNGSMVFKMPFIGWDGDETDTLYQISIQDESNGIFIPDAPVFQLEDSYNGTNNTILRIASSFGFVNPMFKFKGNIAAYNKIGFFTDFSGSNVFTEPTIYINRAGSNTLQFTDVTNGTVTLTNLKAASDNEITSMAVTGSSTKTITLTQKDLGTISAQFVDDTGYAYSDVFINNVYQSAPNFQNSGSISFVEGTTNNFTANVNTIAGLTPGSYTNANITVGGDGRLTLASSGSSGSSNWTNGTNFSYFTDSGDDLGIGYTSDQGNYKLQVDGDIKASGAIRGLVLYSDTWMVPAYGMTSNEISRPSTPLAGTGQFYVKTDNKPYFQNDSGTEYDLTATGAADGNISNVSILADVMTFTGTGGGFNGTVTGLARENSQNDFTTYNTFTVSRNGSSLYAYNSSGLGTGLKGTGGYAGVDAAGSSYDLLLSNSGKINISTFAAAPASSSATGTTGTVIVTADYIFVCTATNTWKRVATSTW